MSYKLRKIGRILRLTIIISFCVLIILDICIQFDAYFISKPFWKPPLLSGLVISMAYLLIAYVINQLLAIMASYLQLFITVLTTLISIVARIAYNIWIRRRKPEYIVITRL